MMLRAFLYLFCIILIGCAIEPSGKLSAIKDKNYLLGLYPVDTTEDSADVAGASSKAYELLVCPVLPTYDADTVKSVCRHALVTKSNRPVVFTTVYPKISKQLGNKEFYTIMVPTVAITPIVGKILRSRTLKIPNLSTSELAELMKRSNRKVAGVAAVSITVLAIMYLFETHVWGADKRELARSQQDIFAKTDLSQAIQTSKSVDRILPLLAKSLDLQVSREAKLLFSASKIPASEITESETNP